MRWFDSRRLTWMILLLASIAVCAWAATAPSLRWRLKVIALRATGHIIDIGWADLLALLNPSAHQSLEPLVDSRSPYMVIRNPMAATQEIEAGRVDFLSRCANCHGSDARGSVAAPALSGRPLAHGSSDWALYR